MGAISGQIDSSGDGGCSLIPDLNDPDVLFTCAGVRDERSGGAEERVYLSKMNVRTRRSARVTDLWLPNSRVPSLIDASAGFKWAGHIHIDQYRGQIEAAVAPRDFNTPFAFFKWTASVPLRPHPGNDRVFAFRNGQLLDVNSGTGSVNATLVSNTGSVTAASMMDTVVYWVSGSTMKRYPETGLPAFANKGAWGGVRAMAGMHDRDHLYVVQNDTLFRVDHRGRRTQVGPAKAWPSVTAMTVHKGGQLFIISGASLYRAYEDGSNGWSNLIGDRGIWSGTTLMTTGSGASNFATDDLYIIKGARLYAVDDGTGIRRVLDNAWTSSTAMGMSWEKRLIVVEGAKLKRVHPLNGSDRNIGGDWSGTKFLFRRSFVATVRPHRPQTRQLGAQARPWRLSVEQTNGKSYQWKHRAKGATSFVPIRGETSPTLTRRTLSFADAGSYYCEVSGLPGISNTVISNRVELEVASYSKITAIRETTNEGAFGTRVVRIGDFDGDGYEDFASSDATANSAGPNTGFVRVTSGRTLGRIVDRRGEGLRNNVGIAGALFGREIAAADFDDDGRDDVLISAPGATRLLRSALYVLRGRTADVVPLRQQRQLYLGEAIAAGHLDGRAGADYLVTYGTTKGVDEYLIAQNAFPDRRLWTVRPGPGHSVRSIAVIGDVNDDGYGDVAIGLPTTNSGRGRWELRSGRDGSRLFFLNGATGDRLGSMVAKIGDINGDWHPDVLVAGSGDAQTGGSLRVCSGRDGRLLGFVRGGVGFAAAVADAGDINRDGVTDFMVTTRRTQGSIVEIRSGKDPKLVLETLRGGVGRVRFGASLASIDHNGDGHRDWLVAEARPGSGRVWVYGGLQPAAHPPAFRSYGRSGPGAGGRLPRMLERNGNASIGQTYRLSMTGLPNLSVAILRLGLKRANIPLDAIGMTGSSLLVDQQLVDWTLRLSRVRGYAFFDLPIPNDLRYAGAKLYWQCFPLDPGLTPARLNASNGAETTIGGIR